MALRNYKELWHFRNVLYFWMFLSVCKAIPCHKPLTFWRFQIFWMTKPRLSWTGHLCQANMYHSYLSSNSKLSSFWRQMLAASSAFLLLLLKFPLLLTRPRETKLGYRGKCVARGKSSCFVNWQNHEEATNGHKCPHFCGQVDFDKYIRKCRIFEPQI